MENLRGYHRRTNPIPDRTIVVARPVESNRCVVTSRDVKWLCYPVDWNSRIRPPSACPWRPQRQEQPLSRGEAVRRTTSLPCERLRSLDLLSGSGRNGARRLPIRFQVNGRRSTVSWITLWGSRRSAGGSPWPTLPLPLGLRSDAVSGPPTLTGGDGRWVRGEPERPAAAHFWAAGTYVTNWVRDGILTTATAYDDRVP